MFEGFDVRLAEVADEVGLRFRVGGAGPPVVLLHGHPRTHTTWHQVAPQLAAGGLTAVCPDLRGYGQSSAPLPREDHAQASKRAWLVSGSRDAQRRPRHLEAEVLDLMTAWIERYRRQAEERFRRLDAVLAAMNADEPAHTEVDTSERGETR